MRVTGAVSGRAGAVGHGRHLGTARRHVAGRGGGPDRLGRLSQPRADHGDKAHVATNQGSTYALDGLIRGVEVITAPGLLAWLTSWDRDFRTLVDQTTPLAGFGDGSAATGQANGWGRR